MNEVVFKIPLNKEDLLQSDNSRQYVVKRTYSKQDLPRKIEGTLKSTLAGECVFSPIVLSLQKHTRLC